MDKSKSDFVEKVLRQMFRMVGRNYSPSIVGKPEWFLSSNWTAAQEARFKAYFVRNARKDLSWDKVFAARQADWFVLSYGWTRRR